QQRPHGTVRRERSRARFARAIEDEGDEGVAGEVVGDVVAGVIGSRLFLVDKRLEDAAEHAGGDRVGGAVWGVVELPSEVVEEAEQPGEGLVRNVEIRVVALQRVRGEEAAYERGDLPEELAETARAFLPWAEAVLKQRAQEAAVERSGPLLLELAAQVAGIVV